MPFTEEEKELLRPFVSNPDRNVFVAHVPGLTGAIFARYSRAKGGFREVLLQEFIRGGQLDAQKADGLIKRVLVAFGDDSVGELDGTHLSFEQVSNLATKVIEDKRIGGSPIEQSSRYVFYDEKVDGKFKFLREPRIMQSKHAKAYEDILNRCFEVYCELIEPMQEHFRRILPLEAAEFKLRDDWPCKKRLEELIDERERKDFERTYRETIRTKACDTIRVVLPAATLTNLGIFGNGRFFQGLLTEMYSHPLSEMNGLARLAHQELDKYIKRYVERAKPNEYLTKKHAAVQRIADELLGNIHPALSQEKVTLLPNLRDQREFLDFTIATMLFPYVEHPTTQIRSFAAGLPQDRKLEILVRYNGDRKSRRDRPGRGLEFGYPFTYDIIGDFGIYRDLHRHRMVTQQRQRLTTRLGFSTPEEITEAGLDYMVREAADISSDLYEKLRQDLREEAQYAVLFGFDQRWNMGMNARELMHLTEIRTIPQGHKNYRRVAKEMHALALKRDPEIATLMGFVDYKDYPFARGDAEAKQRAKEFNLDEKVQR